MAGIIYNGEDGLPRFSSRTGETHTILLPQGMGQRINIRSSSNGLVACYNWISNIYYIGNPEYQDSYIALPQTPRQHNVLGTHVVLVTEFNVLPVAYHLICAIRVDLEPIRYTFDTYTSFNGRWVSHERIDVGGLIHRNTGVSSGIFAYWLTVASRSVIRFDVYNPHVRWQEEFPVNARNARLGTQFQLGRVGNQLGLISVDASPHHGRITLHFLQEGFLTRWQQYTLVRYGMPILNPNMLPLRPIRFDCFNFEVVFWANGRLMIWESSIVDPRTILVTWLNAAGACVTDGFAHISSQYLPVHFPVRM